jgi:hypothetical protein
MKKQSFLLFGVLVLLTGCSSLDTAYETPAIFDPVADFHRLPVTGFRADGVAGIVFPPYQGTDETEGDQDRALTVSRNSASLR